MRKNVLFLGRIAGILLLSYFVLTLNSCRRPFDNNGNVLKVDTLEQMLTGIDNELILDENVFKDRDDSMVIKLNLIRTKMPVIDAGDTSEMVLRYAGIERNYANFLKNYPVMEYDESGYRNDVKAIKQKVLDQKVSQQEFDKYYTTTKPILMDLYKRAKTMTYDNLAIENDFGRTDPVVTALYHKVNGGH